MPVATVIFISQLDIINYDTGNSHLICKLLSNQPSPFIEIIEDYSDINFARCM